MLLDRKAAGVKIVEPRRRFQHRAALTTPCYKEQGMAEQQPILATSAPQVTLPHRVKDIAGQQFGRLIVLAFSQMTRKRARWKCLCECGKECVVDGTKLRTGHTQSCGCYQIDKMIALKTTHQSIHLPEYHAWSAMNQRCTNENYEHYASYGGRGISVCERWRDSFENFYADMGPRPSRKHSLDRYPNQNGNYEPDNCRWATVKEQSRNRRSNHMLEWNGKSQCITEWAEETGIAYGTIQERLHLGWSIEDAITIPVKPWRGRAS